MIMEAESKESKLLIHRIEIKEFDIKSVNHSFHGILSKRFNRFSVTGFIKRDDGCYLTVICPILEENFLHEEYEGKVNYVLPDIDLCITKANAILKPHFIFNLIYLCCYEIPEDVLSTLKLSHAFVTCIRRPPHCGDVLDISFQRSRKKTDLRGLDVIKHGYNEGEGHISKPDWIMLYKPRPGAITPLRGFGVSLNASLPKDWGECGALVTSMTYTGVHPVGILMLRESQHVAFGLTFIDLVCGEDQMRASNVKAEAKRTWIDHLNQICFSFDLDTRDEVAPLSFDRDIQQRRWTSLRDFVEYLSHEHSDTDSGVYSSPDLTELLPDDEECDDLNEDSSNNKVSDIITHSPTHSQDIGETFSIPKDLCSTTFVVDANGGICRVNAMGVALFVPPNALDKEEIIYFGVSKNSDDLPSPSKRKEIRMLTPIIVGGPANMRFKKPAVLFFQHSLLLADIGEPTNFKMFHGDTANGRFIWKAMTEGPLLADQWGSIEIDGFSRYFMGHIGGLRDVCLRILRILVFAELTGERKAQFRVYVIDSEESQETQVWEIERKYPSSSLVGRSILHFQDGETGVEVCLRRANIEPEAQNISSNNMEQSRFDPPCCSFQFEAELGHDIDCTIRVSQSNGDSTSIEISRDFNEAYWNTSVNAPYSLPQDGVQFRQQLPDGRVLSGKLQSGPVVRLETEEFQRQRDSEAGAVGGVPSAFINVGSNQDDVVSVLYNPPTTRGPQRAISISDEIERVLESELRTNPEFCKQFATHLLGIPQNALGWYSEMRLIYMLYNKMTHNPGSSEIRDFFHSRSGMLQSDTGRRLLQHFSPRDQERENIKKNLTDLVEITRTSRMLDRLFTNDVISETEYDRIREKSMEEDRNRELYMTLYRGSSARFRLFIEFLQEELQRRQQDQRYDWLARVVELLTEKF